MTYVVMASTTNAQRHVFVVADIVMAYICMAYMVMVVVALDDMVPDIVHSFFISLLERLGAVAGKWLIGSILSRRWLMAY